MATRRTLFFAAVESCSRDVIGVTLPAMKLMTCLAVIALTVFASAEVRAEETPHLAFVTEYIRELSANETARDDAARELAAASTQNEKLSDGIHSSTLVQLELRSQIFMLKTMRLDPPFDTLIPNMIDFDQQKIDLHQRMIDIASAFLAGPKPGVDYGAMAAEMPKIRAMLDDIDHTMFRVTPMIFATLIDQRPDSQNHLSRLIITTAQRKGLLNDITISFGQKLSQKDQDYNVSSAYVLQKYLLKDYKCSDQP